MYSQDSQIVYDFSSKQTKGEFLTKVFGMMFLCLLITTGVACGLGIAFQMLLKNTMVGDQYDQQVVQYIAIALVVSAIALFVMSIVLPIMFIRGRHNILVPLVIYTILMGVMLSTLVLAIDWVILGEAFGITTIIFGTMALLGYVSKGRLVGIGAILIGLFLGAILLSLTNWIMIMVGGVSKANVTLSWVVSLLIFAFLMLVTLYDVNRIKRIAEEGARQDNNLTYYCAFVLYSDFIAILVRVIYILAALKDR